MTDDEIAERVLKVVRESGSTQWIDDDRWEAACQVGYFLDDAEAYRLAFVADVRERAQVRRQAKRVRAKVFEALGVADRKAVKK